MEPARIVASYRDFASQLIDEGVLSDPWIDGAPRFQMAPVVLDRGMQRDLYRAAEAVAAAHGEVALLCRAQPDLLDRFFDLPPAHRAMWDVGGPDWHGIARADVFRTRDGLQVCELNSDTPSGQPEAVALGRVFGGGAISAPALDPNQSLEARVGDLVERAAARVAAVCGFGPDDARARTVGILYPTEVTDELCVIELHARWFEARGFRVVLGSPYNLQPDGDGGVSLFGVPCPVIWRYYKTDWWGERRPIWRSAPAFLDAAALAQPLGLLLDAVARGRAAVINPFGAVITQNKRAMALMWEEIARFSPRAQSAIRRHVPPTARLEVLSPARLRAERARWVLKSDYGCEGEEVIVGQHVSDRVWATALADARPGRWIAQRRFSALALACDGQVDGERDGRGVGDDAGGHARGHDPYGDRYGDGDRDGDRDGGRARARAGGNVGLHGPRSGGKLIANFGVYVVAGRACGLYTRVQQGITDRRALSTASLVRLP